MLCGKSLVNNFYKYKRKVWQNVIPIIKRHNATYHPPKILFFGTDNFSLPSLQALHRNCSDRLGVVTSFKSPANCVRSYAEKEKLPLKKWPIEPSDCSQFDLGVVVSFGHMIPANIINGFPNGMINVHASLLPKWRGAAPIMYAIMKGDASTGVSIMKIEPHRFDIGAILAQREVVIKPDVFMPELHASLALLGADLLVDTVNNVQERLKEAKLQDNTNASYAPKITNKLTEVVWSELSAFDIYTRYRALFGYKNLTTSFLGKQVQLLELRIPERELLVQEPGTFKYQKQRKSLLIGCAQDSQLEILQLRVEGRKPMNAQDFNNGFLKGARSLNFTQNKLSAN
ncbi:LOW QUALITY PROTEIN: methionyl-tRNA formyltransferase, mitochondrial [Drosophila eugracilis]|uniref:LOW QUALITY PROTEIN: methionyl-tRNA formyltransferase, mitochondrial n=1 Tax=Drosophila eugracilis TaxID=29029 RepID=UPI001BDA6601|nr:LOW QUALITY PROTEIN: methionyl-tRNA formyltransferase, mitochondrial [Drosophila eugracilis]